MLQNVQGVDLYIVVFTEAPVLSLPIHDGGDRFLRPYAEALDTAVLTGLIKEPGKYGIEVTKNHWNVYLIQE